MQVDLESEKLESPNLLNNNDFEDLPIGEDKKLHLPEQDSASDISLQELKGVATTAQLDFIGKSQPKLNEGT